MRRLLLVIGFLVGLFGAPALLACESCVAKDTVKDGSVASWTRCYTECEGDMAWCIPNSETNACDGADDYGQCPDCGGSGGWGEGGGGTGGGGGSCSTGPGGSCPAECFSCGGGGGIFYF